MTLRWRTILLVTGFLALPCHARAGCTTHADASAVTKSAKLLERDNDKRLRRGPSTVCKSSPSPVCAGPLVTDAIAVAYGANTPPAAAVDRKTLHDQLRCQKAIGKGVVSFIRRKLRYLIDGRTS